MRKLTLKRETVRMLTAKELSMVAGATLIPTRCGCTGDYPSLNAPCPTTRVLSNPVQCIKLSGPSICACTGI